MIRYQEVSWCPTFPVAGLPVARSAAGPEASSGSAVEADMGGQLVQRSNWRGVWFLSGFQLTRLLSLSLAMTRRRPAPCSWQVEQRSAEYVVVNGTNPWFTELSMISLFPVSPPILLSTAPSWEWQRRQEAPDLGLNVA